MSDDSSTLLVCARINPGSESEFAQWQVRWQTAVLGAGVWLSLYHQEAKDPVRRVGAGAGLKHPPIARVPLSEVNEEDADLVLPPQPAGDLTIAEAKERLAAAFGVDPASVKVTIEA